MVTLNLFKPYLIQTEHFMLDGGAMFGSVPKELWLKKFPADSSNRIEMTSRVMLLEARDRNVLIDVGLGDKWTSKYLEIYQIKPKKQFKSLVSEVAISDIILTHLHFDHAGALSLIDGDSTKLVLPDVNYYLTAENLEQASNPNIKEAASYLSSHVLPLKSAMITMTHHSEEIIPGIRVFFSHGHTKGLQWILIENKIAFVSDLIPLSSHLHTAYTMGYDMCSESLIKEKEDFLEKAVENNWVVVFQHDRNCAAVRVAKSNSRYIISEEIILEEIL